ncbi:MAG: hypothetical protein IPH14_05205 [Thermomonas sp.]|uniref:hypothetical protein n=1 Tax=Thermomonas sp. TaxID=1971895 RepID=UPI0025E929DA|nr:hypothetical protein [Thermomonas sp.]MBK6924666.1 hypothetical protein [Thermomonas sp.]
MASPGETPPPQNQGIDRHLPVGRARCVVRVVVQEHLRLAGQHAPATGIGVVAGGGEGVMLEHVLAQRGSGDANPGKRVAREAQVPARRVRGVRGETGIAEQRTQRRQQGIDVGLVDAERVADRQQARAVDVGTDVRRVGAALRMRRRVVDPGIGGTG